MDISSKIQATKSSLFGDNQQFIKFAREYCAKQLCQRNLLFYKFKQYSDYLILLDGAKKYEYTHNSLYQLPSETELVAIRKEIEQAYIQKYNIAFTQLNINDRIIFMLR